jgi:sugar fermentation stimulation protein A
MPNSGRLEELLEPEADMILEESTSGRDRKTKFTAVAVCRNKRWIGINAVASNSIVTYLIENKLIPQLEKISVVKTEVSHGNSRFDFLVENEDGKRNFLEVKSVTLSSQGVAMFPDAITQRGQRHLLELARLSSREINPIVIFLVQGMDNDLFIPNYHTDFTFADIMKKVKDRITFIPVAVDWSMNLDLLNYVKVLEIPWDIMLSQIVDTGSYLLTLRVDSPSVTNVGSLGSLELKSGYYIYVGSGMNGLSSRIARHLRRRKKLKWHIDYIREKADSVRAFPIHGTKSIEFELASKVAKFYQTCFPGFGSSDSPLSSHLFFSETDPFIHEMFHCILKKFRFANLNFRE